MDVGGAQLLIVCCTGQERQLIPQEEIKGKIPAALCRKVVASFVRLGGFPAGWAHDGNKIIYTAGPIMKKCLDVPVHVKIEDDDTGKLKNYQVGVFFTEIFLSIRNALRCGFLQKGCSHRIILDIESLLICLQATVKLATTVDVAGLGSFCKGTMPTNAEFNVHEALNIIDNIFRHTAAMDTNCRISGRGIFVRDNPVPVSSQLEVNTRSTMHQEKSPSTSTIVVGCLILH